MCVQMQNYLCASCRAPSTEDFGSVFSTFHSLTGSNPTPPNKTQPARPLARRRSPVPFSHHMP